MAKQGTRITFITALLMICVIRTSSQDIRIEPFVKQLLVGAGNQRVLDCIVTFQQDQHVSPSSLSWSGPTNAIFTMKTRTDNNRIYHNFLTIDSFTTNHVGSYICTFTAPTVSSAPIETKIELITVIENKIEADFSFGNKSAILECTLEFPQASIQAIFKEWRKDNTSISKLKLPERFTDSNNGTLFIKSPTREDSGMYTAVYKVSQLTAFNEEYSCNVAYSAAPIILDMARSKNIVEGDTLHLECLIKGYPVVNVTWWRYSEMIVEEKMVDGDNNRISMEEFRGHENAQLFIRSASASDDGNYSCKATDESGRKASKSIIVRVKDRLEWLWPVLGILCEAAALAIIIFACSKIKKDDHVEKPADEREGLLRQGSSRGHNKDE